MANHTGESSFVDHGRSHMRNSSQRRRRTVLWLAAVSCISVSYVPSARANKTWVSSSGSFTTDTNWSPNGVPIQTDVIEFGPAHAATIFFPPTTSFAVGGFVEKGGAYSELHLAGGSLTVNGVISLGQDGFDNLFVTNGSLVVPAGGGSTQLGNNNAGTAQMAVESGDFLIPRSK